MSIGAVDLYVILIDAVLDINIIWCTVVGGGIDGSLNGAYSAFAHNGVDSEGACCRLMLRICLGINLSIGHTIEEQL